MEKDVWLGLPDIGLATTGNEFRDDRDEFDLRMRPWLEGAGKINRRRGSVSDPPWKV